MRLRSTIAAAIAGALGFFAVAAAADAQTYPSRPLRLVVGFPPGGPTDIVGRLFAQKLTELFKEQVIVDNRPGAGGNIAADHVAKSPANGYTMLLTHPATHAISPTLYSKLPYDVIRDFAPVTHLISVPNMLVVHPSLPVKNVLALAELARRKPGEINFASGGSGTTGHLSGELFKTLAKVDMVHVPYRGTAPAITDLVSGQVHVMIDNMQSLLPYARSGRLRALAVTTTTRIPAAPELPTIAEAGIPAYDVSSWFGIVVPSGTPQNVIARLHAESVNAVKSPDVTARLADLGATPVGSTPEQFAALIKSELARWAPIIRASGARVD